MPRIFDNISQQLLPALKTTLEVAHRADFCVGYFNLRGWKQLDSFIESWPGSEDNCCRLLVGMQQLPEDELRQTLSLTKQEELVDQKTALQLKKRLAQEFREQLTIGAPTNQDEAGLRRLAAQIKAKKLIVKLFLRHPLHAKLYLLFRSDPFTPIVAYMGSSNLTMAGLSKQGELNIDVLEQDAAQKLANWFKDRWNDRLCVDISDELVQIIEESWAREELLQPYHIYIKIAYHLSREARMGLSEFSVPQDFNNKLLEFQVAAVRIAAHHLNQRGGVIIGDVVGLGKTLMATALARIFEDDYNLETLIICPKNLVKMWEDYTHQYRLRAKVISLSQVVTILPNLRRYRLVLIDESHNLRNREGKRYRVIQDYIRANDSRVILLSATPYNKTYLDLSNQLRLFVLEEKDLGIRPERLLREIGETEFIRRHQAGLRLPDRTAGHDPAARSQLRPAHARLGPASDTLLAAPEGGHGRPLRARRRRGEAAGLGGPGVAAGAGGIRRVPRGRAEPPGVGRRPRLAARHARALAPAHANTTCRWRVHRH